METLNLAAVDDSDGVELIEEDGLLVIHLKCDGPLPEHLTEWLRDPVKHERELRMRELMRQCGVEDFE
ncbi:MAG: hypothetical protein HOP19_21455 [Acidobacteria bacterium]|nr:hypothetical protein [Acidobacteriota bacterium]